MEDQEDQPETPEEPAPRELFPMEKQINEMFQLAVENTDMPQSRKHVHQTFIENQINQLTSKTLAAIEKSDKAFPHDVSISLLMNRKRKRKI